MAQIEWSKKASKQLRNVDRRYQQTISDKIDKLADFPKVTGLDIKFLKGSQNSYRLRTGDFRIIFDWIDGKPKIVRIQKIAKRDERTY